MPLIKLLVDQDSQLKEIIMVNRILPTLFTALICVSALASKPVVKSSGSMQIPLLRLKMVLDAFNNDDIAIGFYPGATTQYNNQLDSKYMPGIGALEGLSSLSSDNVQLSVNIVPLPALTELIIPLDVEAAGSNTFTLERTQLDSIPQIFDIWLMDKYAKDSINLRTTNSYAFSINKNDTTTFGANRFTVVIRQSQALCFRLTGFNGRKETIGNELTWTTQNEQNNTGFLVERSIDDGATFFVLDSLSSNGSGLYNFLDKSPLDGANLYRLKTTDMNGTVTWSNIVTIDSRKPVAAQAGNAVNVYPNPSNGYITLAINSAGGDVLSDSHLQLSTVQQSFTASKPNNALTYDIKIVNIRGVTVRSAISSSATWEDNVSNLAPGTYFVQVISKGDNKVVGKSSFVKL